MNQLVVEQLKKILKQNGSGLLDNPLRLEGLLADACQGQMSKEIFVLMTALREGVPQSLLVGRDGMLLKAAISRQKEKLQTRRGFDPDVSTWAVSAWCDALELKRVKEEKTALCHDPIRLSQMNRSKRLWRDLRWHKISGISLLTFLTIVLTAPVLGMTARVMDLMHKTAGPILAYPLLLGVTLAVVSVMAWWERWT